MQRIGRLDRRLDADIEAKLNRIDPTVHVWNFLPPEELEDILRLRQRVDGKILRISRTLGMKGSSFHRMTTMKLSDFSTNGMMALQVLKN